MFSAYKHFHVNNGAELVSELWRSGRPAVIPLGVSKLDPREFHDLSRTRLCQWQTQDFNIGLLRPNHRLCDYRAIEPVRLIKIR